jgi:hypothetical protein
MEMEHLSLRKHLSFTQREALGERKGESDSRVGIGEA